jgi:NADH dehydrogenase
MKKTRVVILGGGFAGLTAARALNAKKIFEVLVVDRNNFQTFLPLLYQVSTSGLAADHVAHPIRGALRKSDIDFRMGSPISIDYKNKSIKLDSSESFHFDYLVFALGSVTNDFGIKGVKEHALGMKSVQDALLIRSTILRHFEDLCRYEIDSQLSINIIGGGPTGVEMAGAIAELKNGPLKRDSASAATQIRINIIEAGKNILPMFSTKLSQRAEKDLRKLGVTINKEKIVKEIKSDEIHFKDGTNLQSDLTIWTAGVTGEQTIDKFKLPVVRGRLDVDSKLQVKNYPFIFAIGDIAGAHDESGALYPMVAPVAMQQGRFLADQLVRLSTNKKLEEFKYRDKGSMATIGRHKAIVEVGKIRFSGVIAWYAWLWLHLFYLLGGRNKLGTMADWTWNYLTFDRSNRHIIDLKE